MPSKSEMGHSHELNHVSSASSSWHRSPGCRFSQPLSLRAIPSAFSGDSATTKCSSPPDLPSPALPGVV